LFLLVTSSTLSRPLHHAQITTFNPSYSGSHTGQLFPRMLSATPTIAGPVVPVSMPTALNQPYIRLPPPIQQQLQHHQPMGVPPSLCHSDPLDSISNAILSCGAYAQYQSILYWYPSPPISPQNTMSYYVSAFPTTVLMKGLPSNVQPSNILDFLDGLFEVLYYHV